MVCEQLLPQSVNCLTINREGTFLVLEITGSRSGSRSGTGGVSSCPVTLYSGIHSESISRALSIDRTRLDRRLMRAGKSSSALSVDLSINVSTSGRAKVSLLYVQVRNSPLALSKLPIQNAQFESFAHYRWGKSNGRTDINGFRTLAYVGFNLEQKIGRLDRRDHLE